MALSTGTLDIPHHLKPNPVENLKKYFDQVKHAGVDPKWVPASVNLSGIETFLSFRQIPSTTVLPETACMRCLIYIFVIYILIFGVVEITETYTYIRMEPFSLNFD